VISNPKPCFYVKIAVISNASFLFSTTTITVKLILPARIAASTTTGATSVDSSSLRHKFGHT